MASTVDLSTELASLRLQGLSEEDGHFLAGTNPGNSFGPQNEAGALTKLVEQYPASKAPAQLAELCDTFVSRTSLSALRQAHGGGLDSSCSTVCVHPLHATDVKAPVMGQAYAEGSPEDKMAKWATQHGIITCLQPASFPITVASSSSASTGVDLHTQQQSAGQSAPAQVIKSRGLMAATAVPAGRTLVSVPLDQLISYQTALESDLGAVLQRIPGLDTESAVVIWTMLDRCDPESPRAPFWSCLPTAFGTGLGVSSRVLHHALRTCPDLLDEATKARQHVRQQFEALGVVFTALLQAYPQYIKPEQLNWHSYIWAVQLWYAYAIQVQMADGQLQPCLVPLTILMNHSPWPHAVAFSRLDVKTKRLNVKSFRSVSAGHEALLSYGPLPNAKLLLFYGFAVPDNPYDHTTLTVPVEGDHTTHASDVAAAAKQDVHTKQERPSRRRALLQACRLSFSHGVRGWGPLPPTLLAAARVATASEVELEELHVCCQPVHSKSSSKGGKKKHSASSGGATGVQTVLTRLCTASLSVGSEKAALQLLLSVVAGQLAQHQAAGGSTSQGTEHSDGDGEFDDGAAGPGFQASALIYVAGQVQVLSYVHQVVKAMLLQFDR